MRIVNVYSGNSVLTLNPGEYILGTVPVYDVV
jgi:hypothetical protein